MSTKELTTTIEDMNRLLEAQEAQLRNMADLMIEVRSFRQDVKDDIRSVHTDIKQNKETTEDIHRKVNVLAPKDKIKLTRIIDKYLKDIKIKDEFFLEAREWIKGAFVPNGLYKNMSIDDLLQYETDDANLISAFTKEIIELTNLLQARKIHQGWIETTTSSTTSI